MRTNPTPRFSLLNPQSLKILLFFFVALAYTFLYTFLHEGGHALVAALSGGVISAFNINFLDLSAHVAITGALSPTQINLMNLAGVSLPFLAWVGFILAVPKRTNLALELFKFVSSVGAINVLLVWIILPLLYLTGSRPRDDAINFLNSSHFNPLLVSGTAFLIYAGGWALFLSKIDGVRREIDRFIQPGWEWLTPAAGWTVGALTGLFVACGLAAFALNGFSFTTPPLIQTLQPPAGYHLQQTLDLSDGEHTGDAVLTFNLDQTRLAGVFIIIRDISPEMFDLRLTGPNQYDKLLIHAEGYATNLDGAGLEETLPAGQHQLILTSKVSRGTLSIYTR